MRQFLHVPGFLTKDEVDALNASFDANWDKRHQGVGGSHHEFTGMLEWPAAHSQPFRDLLVHPKAIPYLNTQFGRGWRMVRDTNSCPVGIFCQRRVLRRTTAPS